MLCGEIDGLSAYDFQIRKTVQRELTMRDNNSGFAAQLENNHTHSNHLRKQRKNHRANCGLRHLQLLRRDEVHLHLAVDPEPVRLRVHGAAVVPRG